MTNFLFSSFHVKKQRFCVTFTILNFLQKNNSPEPNFSSIQENFILSAFPLLQTHSLMFYSLPLLLLFPSSEIQTHLLHTAALPPFQVKSDLQLPCCQCPLPLVLLYLSCTVSHLWKATLFSLWRHLQISVYQTALSLCLKFNSLSFRSIFPSADSLPISSPPCSCNLYLFLRKAGF